MNLEKLEQLLKDEKKYRLFQIKKAIFVDLIEDPHLISSLPKELREKLNKELDLKINAKLFESQKTNTKKILITLNDSSQIESVLMQYESGRNTVCVSCQVGCPMNCSFCLTGQMGFKRNLTVSEIIEQVLYFQRLLKKHNDSVKNIVFMGMGEPMLNYENVISAIKILNDKDAFNIGARKISISTCGIVNGINKLGDENIQSNLAISLHAPNDKIRSKIMPINNKDNIESILKAVKNYIKTTNRKVMFEYALIDGINDSEKNALELAKLMKNKLFMVNLIKYNKTGVYKSPKTEVIKKFKDILIKNGVNVTERYRFGEEINAACGQLAGKS
ncbi:MAG TPA: 23S rRNA (adenine(2503)-C(2))-methyltransferase RlmN [bacterium]|jgi:23S rRNA (adenine2503-C2)-methyltransferase|nr:23S rRNA (adenine(2503)-C(2))-methyltransferase RlmN [bacterium]HOG37907.1 23S rRNA (adenine(2503)-C(2))-methyltransferase RlmN [bacterium]HQI02965.1 23S rRNA (adenine(2503)-C(2))-methyltransferase RlmN [bacterium]